MRPVFILVGIFVFKVVFLRSDYDAIKLVMALSSLILIGVTSTYLDKEESNNAKLTILAAPISAILIMQALLDYCFLYHTQSLPKRLFYCLDSPWRKFSVHVNCMATAIYCSCLFYWMYQFDYNRENNQGVKQDAKNLHFAISTFIFYAICLIERVGTYILDILH